MLFNSWPFVLFFAVVFIAYRPMNRRWQNVLLRRFLLLLRMVGLAVPGTPRPLHDC